MNVLMGIDKLRLVAEHPPVDGFWDEINRQLNLPRDHRSLNIGFLGTTEIPLSQTCLTQITIKTRPGVAPAFYLKLNQSVPDGRIVNIFECNPNKLAEGMRTLDTLMKTIFGGKSRLKVSRIDLNADVSGLSVDFFQRALRIPRKRKATEFRNSDAAVQLHSNRGMTGFYLGKSPSRLRVYDKREEMKELKEDVTRIPSIFTRIEWELRHNRCPIRYLSEIHSLLNARPFEPIQILRTEEIYDFHNDSRASVRNFTFNKLAQEFGVHDASRILNASNRNFIRDFKSQFVDTSEIHRQLQKSYFESTKRFFENQPQDLRLSHEFTLDS